MVLRRLSGLILGVLVAASATARAEVAINSTPQAPADMPQINLTLLNALAGHDYRKENGVTGRNERTDATLKDFTIPNPDLKTFNFKLIISGKKGAVDGGGGDELGIEFQLAVSDFVREYKQYQFNPTDLVNWGDVTNFASALHYQAADAAQFSVGGQPSLSITMNDLASKTVFVRREAWNTITDQRIKNAIAMNAALLMKRGQVTGVTQEAYQDLSAAGISPSVLAFGVASAPSAKDAAETRSSQCVWARKRLEEEISWWNGTALTECDSVPGIMKFKSDLIDTLALRCLTNCVDGQFAQLHDVCLNDFKQFYAMRKMEAYIQPRCQGPQK